MSKRPRKKSPEGRPAGATGARSSKSVKTPRPAAADAPKKPSRNATSAASHKAPSKKLKLSGAGIPRGPAHAKTAAPRPATGNSPERRPSSGTRVPTESALTEGSTAPDFRLPRDGGGSLSLSDFPGQNLVLFFYPRADTPGCTREAIDFTRLLSAFGECRTALLGISADPPRKQEAFRDKHRLATPLASDERHEILQAYGAWGEKSMYGKTFQGILRTTVLIGRDRRVIRIWRNVRVDGHAEEVLATIRALPV
jgi:peroxiredoxin Q/BCP